MFQRVVTIHCRPFQRASVVSLVLNILGLLLAIYGFFLYVPLTIFMFFFAFFRVLLDFFSILSKVLRLLFIL